MASCSFVFWDVAALTASSLHMRSLSFFLFLRSLQRVDWTASCGLQLAGVHFEFCVWKETKTWRKMHKLISWFRAEWTNHTREKGLRGGLVRCPQVSPMLIGPAVSDDSMFASWFFLSWWLSAWWQDVTLYQHVLVYWWQIPINTSVCMQMPHYSRQRVSAGVMWS